MSATPWHEADHGATLKVPVAAPPTAQLTLRVTVTGPNANLTGVFDLGAKRFVIGRANCHLRLPKAAIPDRSIEVYAAPGGFIVAGIDGFPLILGSITAPSALVLPGQSVRLVLIPYSIELQTSHTPGSPLKDLADPQPIASQPTASQPTASQPTAATPQPTVPPQPIAPPTIPASGARAGVPRGPLIDPPKMKIQELAADVRPQQMAFGGGGGRTSVLDELDGDMTITDMGAKGLHARSRNVDPLQGLDISLVRADGPQEGQRFQVTKTPLIIGRSDLGLLGMTIRDSRVSSKHAQLEVSGPLACTLKDLASTNGTTVNGRPISIAQLGNGDLVSFGGVTFTFKVQKR